MTTLGKIFATFAIFSNLAPLSFAAENFESASGNVTDLETAYGKLIAEPNQATIHNKGKSGSKSLRILGGENRKIELKLKESPSKDVDLQAWAERWTGKTPFKFQIIATGSFGEKEIFNGEKSIKTGGFHSEIRAKIPAGTQSLKFVSSTPDNSGILLDDLHIVPCIPMKLTSEATTSIPVVPAMIRKDFNPILRIDVSTDGALNALSARELKVDLTGTTQPDQIETLELVRGRETSNDQNVSKERLTLSKREGNQWVLSGDLPLEPGKNHLWLSARLKPTASIDGKLALQAKEISIGEKKLSVAQEKAATQRIGVSVTVGGDKELTRNRVSKSFRIPGLARSKKGTLVAVFDIRYNHAGDLPADIDVGVRRSEDGGQTWDDLKIAMSCKEIFKDEKVGSSGCGDPAILVDEKTGRIWVAALWSHGNNSLWGSKVGNNDPHHCGQFVLVYSDDDGKTWSAPINITDQIKDPSWGLYFNGPGSGIQTKDGTLVFPSQYWADVPGKGRKGHSSIIYSKDSGKTWKTGKTIRMNTSEAQVVELSDGALMLNARNEGRSGWRCVYTSKDLGETWSEHATNSNKTGLREPGACQASIIGVKNINSTPLTLIFSNPDSNGGRNKMSIKTSKDDGATWSAPLLYDERNGAGYSSLAPVDEKHVGVFYEGVPGYMYFLKIPYSELN